MICWSDKSRYGDSRDFSFNEDSGLLEVVCYNTLYYSWSESRNKDVVSVDPDGGPYMGERGKLYTGNNVIVIDKILDNEYNGKCKVLFVKMKARKL